MLKPCTGGTGRGDVDCCLQQIASWPIWLALILFIAAYSVIDIASNVLVLPPSDPPPPDGGAVTEVPLTTRYNWNAVLVGIIAGLCAIVKFFIDIGIWFGWLPEKLQALVQKKPPFD